MATKFGTNRALQNSAIPSLMAQGEVAGRIHVQYDEYVFTGDLAVNDVIQMGSKLPAGARVLDVILDSPDLDSAAAGALTSGWLASDDAVEAASANGFLTTLDVHTAGKTQAMSALLASSVAGKYKRFASAVQPAITISGETDATTGTIRQAIYYIID
jgi:hypothetical protein